MGRLKTPHAHYAVCQNLKTGSLTHMVFDVAPILASVRRLVNNLLQKIDDATRHAYTGAGRLTVPVKEWYGEVTTIDGTFTFDCSSAHFTKILHVDPAVVFNSTDFNAQTLASLNTVSTTRVTGRIVTGGMIVLGGASLQKRNAVTVMVKITGT